MRESGEVLMDNRQICVQLEGRLALIDAMRLFFYDGMSKNGPTKKATHYFDSEQLGLCFYDGITGDFCNEMGKACKPIRLPTKLTAPQAAEVAWLWLMEQPNARRKGAFAEFDGSKGHGGFRIYANEWGCVADSGGAFVAIQPVWALYGK